MRILPLIPLLLATTLTAAGTTGGTAAAKTAEGAKVASPAKSPSRRDPEIRLLCVADDLPIRYAKTAGGRELPVFSGFDEEPPGTVYVKRSGAYKPLALPRNTLSKPHADGDERSGKIEGYFIKTFAAMDIATAWTKTAAAMSAQQKGAQPQTQTQPEAKSKEPEWASLAASPPQDGKDYLVCVYQPSTTAKWYPPKVMHVNVSPAAAPAGTLLVLNLSDRPALVRIGSGKPLQVPPSETITAAAPGFDTPFPVAVAARARTGNDVQVMTTRSRTLPAGHCGVIALHSLYERTSEKPVGVKFSTYEVPPPRLSN